MNKNVPKLRFKEFNYEWEQKKLSDYVERVIRKNKENITNRPLTISAQYGLVDQEEFFNKVVASKNLEGYYLLNNGEFAYNKSYSNGYPFGAIKRLDKYENGAVSTLYICFKPQKNVNSNFLTQYFECSKWHKEVSMIAVEGARNHGLLNIAVSDFFETLHVFPSLQEQEKIANFFTILDSLIEEQDGKVSDLELYKKGMMQKIFSQEIRFKDENGCEYPEWEYFKIGEFIEERIEKIEFNAKYPLYSLTIEDGVIPKSERYERNFLVKKEGNFKKIYKNDFAYNPMNLRFGALAVCNEEAPVAISGYYNIFKFIKGNPKFWINYLKIEKLMYLYNTIATGSLEEKKRVHYSQFKELKLKTPLVSEQNKIAEFLSNIDNLIEKEKKNLDDLRKMKKGLLQRMFV